MLRRLFPARRSELRDSLTAFFFLFIFVGGHAILEATRDALFLAKIPTTRLPWVYVALAVTALLATRAQAIFRRTTPRRVLIGWTVFASVGTLAICLALPLLGHVGLYAFYIWSGVISTIVFIHFWSLVGGLFSIRQAKRLYGMIGLGAGLGAMMGSGAVGLATGVVPRHLAIAASMLFVVAAPLPFLFTSNGSDGRATEPDEAATRRQKGQLGEVLRRPYILRILLVSALVTIAVTLSDFIFKSEIAAHHPHGELASVFGRVNLALNALSVGVQVFVVRALLARLPLPLVFGVLPLGLAAGGVGIALTGAMVPAILTKGVDGTVRFSVHRTASELLLVPLEEGPRAVAKSFMDVVGQRGAQMVGSFVILAAVALQLPLRWLGALLALTAAAAALGAALLRRDYAQMFKDALSSGRRRLSSTLTDLDVKSLESLLASLDSESDAEIVSTLKILDREGKARVIPGLILYHPSELVVVTALRIFGLRGRMVPLHAIEHLEHSGSIRVRAEAMAARAVLAPNAADLSAQLARERSPDVRTAIIATMAVFSMMPEGEAHRALADIVENGSVDSRRLVAEVVGWRRATRFEAEVAELARAKERDVKRAAISALGALGTESAADTLVGLLTDTQVGAEVREAIAAAGPAGVKAVRSALRDPEQPRAVRRLVPALFVDLDSAEGPGLLLENLAAETDGMVRYRSILALGLILSAQPDTKLDRRLLEEELQRTVARAYRYLDRIVALQRATAEEPARRTTGHGLLVDLLRDKQRQTVGRVFRLLALLNPNEEIEAIFASMERDKAAHRASALELIHIVLRNPLRDAVIGLFDDVPDDERRARGKSFHEPQELDYDAVIAQMLDSTSVVVRQFAAYHVGEIGLASQLSRIGELAASDTDSGDFTRALRHLTASSTPPTALSDRDGRGDADAKERPLEMEDRRAS